MRVLALLIKLTVILVVLGLIMLFVGREIVLSMGLANISESVQALRNYQKRSIYYDVCTRKGSQVMEGTDFVTYQLRFTSSTDYVLEAICAQLEFDPVLIEKKSLPRFTSKKPGDSGLIMSRDKVTGIQLVALNELAKSLDLDFIAKHKAVAVNNMQLVYPQTDQLLDEGPISSCAGYGYVCCDNLTRQGIGEQITGLADCPDTCFSSCETRPSLLSFTTNPLFDPKTRKIKISQGSGLEFHFVVDGGKSQSVLARINYGDGQTDAVTALDGKTSHRYVCPSAPCYYQAVIELEDDWGVKSIDSSITRINIEVL
ncbi:MAG: hypothetical protein ABIJ03_00500 [Patescibacteria group bacterium]|nr:hypothetical protein [Patescibacteria group bacterium]